MSGAPGAPEEQEESGPLVFQRGKKLNDDYYIISVRDNSETAIVKFAAYELDSSETFELGYSYADFDALFKSNPDLVNPQNKEGRYDWVVDRLDFATDSSGGAKKLALASAPTAETEGPNTKAGPATKVVPKDRLTFAERQRLRQEAEKLEEKRAASIALKSERNRKAFVAELQDKRKLEELKAASRRQRIDEERTERREKLEMQKRIEEERQKRYDENNKKREDRIDALVCERKSRDLAAIRKIIEAATEKKESLRKKLEDARNQKQEEVAASNAMAAAKKEAQMKVDQKREEAIAERNDRLKQAEREYLEFRGKMIEKISEEQREKDDRKREYLREKAAERAAQLKAKHEKLEAWERLEDTRTQSNLNKEHTRNQMMLEHIEQLRAKQSQEQAEAAARKQASLEARKEAEIKEAEALAESQRNKQELEAKRNAAIETRESARNQKNQQYCDYIRDLKTSEALRIRDQQKLVQSARDKRRHQQLEDRRMQTEQENSAAIINSQREENIRMKERQRDRQFAVQVKEMKEKEKERALELEAKKIARRLQEKENAVKLHEEEQQRRRQMALLEEQRESMIKERTAERNKREQDRIKSQQGQSGDNAVTTDPPKEAAISNEQIPAPVTTNTEEDKGEVASDKKNAE
jgi:hypothetical protein|mmetsp:Transcript_50843/g.80585  ORF Transcript_50843/g.80585 Transcript_50843/m.80585 type:complete len:643 (+) Transcript_50843:74-2002(+)|eukprot:CAMPEP_0169101614 /NCGR_PEP_ID=MMETSP1015-20121227/21725_1 /TAXON_ID=342587 /ORGANISM="Karlodinium micrum, Strain CCMP2283" /LENGTH=642 /DNA_ID=CAMNT_0009162655 /DNA_START=77 /DNA_END=2005 /DNA_ORIENTATION=-